MGVRVLLVDDHPVVAHGLMAIASQRDDDLEAVGVASSFAACRELLAKLDPAPDVVVMDLNLGDGTKAPESIAQLTSEGCAVVVLTSELRPIPLQAAIQAGARGLALKSNPIEELIAVIRAVAAGDTLVTSDLAYVIVNDVAQAARLTEREVEVLQLVADGVARKSLGSRMQPPVSTTTAVTYLNRAIEKYREQGRIVSPRSDAVRAAIEDGYLDPPGPRS